MDAHPGGEIDPSAPIFAAVSPKSSADSVRTRLRPRSFAVSRIGTPVELRYVDRNFPPAYVPSLVSDTCRIPAYFSTPLLDSVLPPPAKLPRLYAISLPR